MSGTGPAAPTRMDRLQNHVTGSLLLNMIDNTAKLNKKFTSSSSSLSEDLKTLQTKVNQMYDSVTQAAGKAEAAADKASDANTTAQEAAKVAEDAKTAAEKAAGDAAAIANPVLKEPDGGADQTISGKLIATDFKSGDVSLVDLAGDVILKNPSSTQTISNNLKLSDGVLTIESRVTGNTLLDVNGNITSTGTVTAGTIKTDAISVKSTTADSTINLNSPTQVNADMTIGTADDNPKKKLTVNGEIEATDFTTSDGVSLADLANSVVLKNSSTAQTIYGNVNFGSSSSKANLSVNGVTKLNGQVTVGSSFADDDADLNVNGVTKLNGNVTIGRTSPGAGANLTVYGDIISGDITSSDTLSANDIKTDAISVKSTTANSTIDLNSPTQVNADMTIGTSTDNPKKKLTVNGNIKSTGIIIANSISSTSYPTESTIALGGPDDEKTVTIRGETSIGTDGTGGSRNLTVYGNIESTGTITIGKLSISYDSASGIITFEDTSDSKSTTITLK